MCGPCCNALHVHVIIFNCLVAGGGGGGGVETHEELALRFVSCGMTNQIECLECAFSRDYKKQPDSLSEPPDYYIPPYCPPY